MHKHATLFHHDHVHDDIANNDHVHDDTANNNLSVRAARRLPLPVAAAAAARASVCTIMDLVHTNTIGQQTPPAEMCAWTGKFKNFLKANGSQNNARLVEKLFKHRSRTTATGFLTAQNLPRLAAASYSWPK